MLKDQYGREVNYLRISVTQRCNFRCQYCMPTTPFNKEPKENLLTFEELFAFVKNIIDCGVNKIRITGGEPLLRNDLHKFIQMINEYKSDIDLAITTNGYLLRQCALKLKNAGLKRINLSLDTLNRQTAKKLSQKDILTEVLDGLEEALRVGLKVKINSVIFKDINDNEVLDLIDFCKRKNITIRFIEYMENLHGAPNLKAFFGKEILEEVKKKYHFERVEKCTNSPASYFKLEDGYEFGLIDPYKEDFCKDCNRIRLSSSGDLIPCLYFEDSKNIKEAAQKKDDKQMLKILQEVLDNKPEKNKWAYTNKENETSLRAFYFTGG